MAPSKVLVFLTQIEYNGLRRWKRKKDGPNQGRPFQLFVDYYDKLSNFMRALLALESFSNSIRMDDV